MSEKNQKKSKNFRFSKNNLKKNKFSEKKSENINKNLKILF